MLEQFASVVANTIGQVTFRPAVIKRKTYADNGSGTMSTTLADIPVRVQLDALTQSMRGDEAAEDDVRLLILAQGIDRVKDDDLVVLDGVTYAVAAPTVDPARTHWICRGRRKA